MIDVATKEPLRVLAYEGSRPYLWVSMEQLPHVQVLLDGNGFRYWPDGASYIFNDDPETTVLNFHYGTDPVLVQRLLDEIP